VAAVLVKKGLVKPELNIKMAGGSLKIGIDDNWNIGMTGEVREIASGTLSRELIAGLTSR
jgi:diaminopimelate epimerase